MYKIITTLLFTLALCCCGSLLDDDVRLYEVAVSVDFPEGTDAAAMTDAFVTFKNVSTGAVTTFAANGPMKVMQGLYDVSFEADVVLDNGVTSRLRAMKQAVTVVADGTVVRLKASGSIVADDFIISEIFFTGTLQTSGNAYAGDDYIKIYNNSDRVIYADGLALFESKFLTTEKYDFTPDIMGEAMTVDAVYVIPGSGRDHPVEPGGYILLADNAVDHRAMNPNSFDLSHADWEWYDESSTPAQSDFDNPAVENLDKWYCYTRSFWMLHNRGFKAYGLARIPVGKESWLRDYVYSYDYEIITAAGSFPMTQTAYRMPNEWIVDLVTLSVESKYQWNISIPSLDCGWTSCGKIDGDKTRYFKAVRRKFLYIGENGVAVFQDTNNSTADFNASVTPSEIERQKTPLSVTGERPAAETYDGVIEK